MFTSTETSLEKKAGDLEELSRIREKEKESKLREARLKSQAKAAAYRRILLSKIIAPIILFFTVIIGSLLWIMAR